ncbi:MAG: outer membrane beta-barrel protein [Candidatus Omnitrophica bacterium]|nr:outer membrane beta-barrel protein [Candidatus Omnitrophota bacterium]
MRFGKNVIVGVLSFFLAPAVYSFELGSFEVTPVATVKEQYDDNITSDHTDVLSDFSTLLSLDLEGVRETKTETLKIVGSIDQEIFTKEHDFNNTSQGVLAKYKKEFSAYDRLTVDNTFTHADKPTSLDDEFGRVAGRYDYFKNTFKLGGEHDFTEQLTVKGRYVADYYDPSKTGLKSSMLHKPGIEAAYALNSRTIGSLFYDYSNYAYEPGGTATKHTTGAGVRRFFTSQIYLDVKGAADYINTITRDNTIKAMYFVGLTNEFDETTQGGISFTKSSDFRYSSSALFESWRVTASWGRQFTERMRFNIAAFTGIGEDVQSGSEEKFNGVITGLEFEVSRNVKLGVDYAFRQRDAEAADQDYDKNTVTMGITVKF